MGKVWAGKNRRVTVSSIPLVVSGKGLGGKGGMGGKGAGREVVTIPLVVSGKGWNWVVRGEWRWVGRGKGCYSIRCPPWW